MLSASFRNAREIAYHAFIYAAGQAVGKCVSLALLPLYTRCLSPADFGCLAVLDVVGTLLTIIVGAGLAAAVNRFHANAQSADEQAAVWWTALAACFGAGMVLILPAALNAEAVSAWISQGLETPISLDVVYCTLASVVFGSLGNLLLVYFRAYKWSLFYVVLSLLRLALNVALNLWFVVGLKMGLLGIVAGNLLASAWMTGCLLLVFLARQRGMSFDFRVVYQLLAFGSPIIVTSLLATCMHQADRLLLCSFVTAGDIGVYSLAYQIAQAVNTLCLVPFSSIWCVKIYEIDREADGRQIFCDIFEYFVAGLSLVLFAVSIAVGPLVTYFLPESYRAVGDLVPVVCLGYFFFSLHEHFRVPAMLTGRTLTLVPVFVAATVVNVAANLVLSPIYGIQGAAWATVLTFAAFSFVGLVRYRRIEKFDYRFDRCNAIVIGVAACFLACRTTLAGPGWSLPATFAALVFFFGLATLWTAFVLRAPLVHLLEALRRRTAVPALAARD
ncbi:MAG: lipopolysaccharide biosynthesis protein [Planctomycetia bacterium]